MKKQEYWRVAFNIIPNYCGPITFIAVISEPLESFCRRNQEDNEFQRFHLIMACACNKKTYILFKEFNPIADGCCARFKKEDYLKH